MANRGDVKKGQTFKVGVNLAPLKAGGDERRFEAGDAVPDDLTKEQLKALRELDAIEG